MNDRGTTWITTGEVARIFGVHRRTVRGWAQRGVIPYIQTDGGHLRFDAAAMAELLENVLDDDLT